MRFWEYNGYGSYGTVGYLGYQEENQKKMERENNYIKPK